MYADSIDTIVSDYVEYNRGKKCYELLPLLQSIESAYPGRTMEALMFDVMLCLSLDKRVDVEFKYDDAYIVNKRPPPARVSIAAVRESIGYVDPPPLIEEIYPEIVEVTLGDFEDHINHNGTEEEFHVNPEIYAAAERMEKRWFGGPNWNKIMSPWRYADGTT